MSLDEKVEKEDLTNGNKPPHQKGNGEHEPAHRTPKGKTEGKSANQLFHNLTKDEQRGDELTEGELEEIVGGLTSVVVPICTNCHKRVAVYQMNLCAVCFLELK